MEIIPHVHRIPGVRGAEAYLVTQGRPALVDTGMPGNAERILAYVQEVGLAPGDLARIVLTHYHIDHIGSAAALKELTLARVAAHPGDAPYISGEQPQPAPRGALMRLLTRLLPMMSRVDPVAVDLPLADGERLDLLGGATVIHVPGHTPGAVALHFPAEGLLICGDAISHRGGRLGPPPAAFTVHQEQAYASLRRLAALEFEVLCAGHGEPITSGADRQVRALARTLD